MSLQGPIGTPPKVDTIHDLYHHVLQDFTRAWHHGGCQECLTEENSGTVRECLSVLYMWAQGLDLHRLENYVDEDSGLQAQVIRMLTKIRRVVVSGLLSSITTDVRT
jgi:hypothetical protein